VIGRLDEVVIDCHHTVVVDSMGGFQVMVDPEGNEFCFVNGPTSITD
jgi:hypothetical protein